MNPTLGFYASSGASPGTGGFAVRIGNLKEKDSLYIK